MNNSPEHVALMFLSNFTNVPKDELAELDITHALTDLLCRVVQDTVDAMHYKQEERVIH